MFSDPPQKSPQSRLSSKLKSSWPGRGPCWPDRQRGLDIIEIVVRCDDFNKAEKKAPRES
jgi:hypothetical protein